MKHLDLFSGIGGFSLACEWAGIETIGFVEIDSYCQKVLRKHWPDVPIVEDIRDVKEIQEVVANATGGRLQQCEVWRETADDAGEVHQDRRTGCGVAKSSALLITAGFPCQPFSVAGKRQRQADNRYLWPETVAVIEAIRPTWILLENVTGIINLALDTVLFNLEGAGYSYETLIVPACAVNAPHRRDRVWIVAYSQSRGTQAGAKFNRETLKVWGYNAIRCSQDVAHTERRQSWEQTEQEGGQDTSRGSEQVIVGNAKCTPTQSITQAGRPRHSISKSSWWAVEPELGRVAHGIPDRVDRLKCLGNAIVPQVAYQIIRTIAGMEDE